MICPCLPAAGWRSAIPKGRSSRNASRNHVQVHTAVAPTGLWSNLFAPGTHRDETIDRWGHGDSVPAELEPGDALVYSGYVLHGGGANQTTDRWRKAMHLSVVAGWLTPEEASPLDFALGELADHSPRVQQLLGHRSYDPRPHRGGGLWLRHVKELDPAGD